MTPRRLAPLLGMALLPLAAAAGARECQVDLGHGWPPATANYGKAAEQLFTDGVRPALALTWLPHTGKESGLALWPGAEGADWRLRYSRADQRILHWQSGGTRAGMQLRIDQRPDVREVPMPAALAQRLLGLWRQALQQAVQADRTAPVLEREVMSLALGEDRYSGAAPRCGPAGYVIEQATRLIEATDTKDSKRDRRWDALSESLDELQQSLAGQGG